MKFPSLFSKLQSILSKRKQKKQTLGTIVGNKMQQRKQTINKYLNQ